MTLDDVKRMVTKHEDEIRAFGVRGLWLFGSTARGEARPESDLDLLVEFEAPCSYGQYSGLRFFLEDLLGQTVDLVLADGLRPRVRPYVERDAVRVA
jgi:predicted nucleotidyltransferase